MSNAPLRKAAILIKYLDPPTAEGLLRQLPPQQAAELREAARQLGQVDPREQQAVLEEFRRNANPASRAVAEEGGVELAGSLADRDEPDDYFDDEPLPQPSAPRSRAATTPSTFQFLHDSEAEELARLLELEHPQTIALVLAHVSADRASEVLLCLSKAQQGEVVRRLVDLDEVNPVALEAVKQNLEEKLRAHIAGRKRRATGLATLQQILHAAGPIAEHELRRTLSQDGQLAQLLGAKPTPRPEEPESKVVGECRLFEELATLADHDLLQVVRRVDRACLQFALAGSPVRLAERMLKVLPAKEAKALRQQMHNLGPLQLRDIEDAQDELIGAAMALESSGDIRWPSALVGGAV